MLLRLNWKRLKAGLELLRIDKERKNRLEKEQRMLTIGSQELLTLEEAAFYIGCSQEILLQEVVSLKVPGGKIGRKWYFHTYSLQEHFQKTNWPTSQSFKVKIGAEEFSSSDRGFCLERQSAEGRREIPSAFQLLSPVDPKLVNEFVIDVANGERDFEGINLIGANLSHLILINMDLDKALLVNADLQGSDLYDSLMRDAYLMKANLQGANLSHVDLQGADLRQANLTNANLTNANLRGAKLTNINLSGAILKGTTF